MFGGGLVSDDLILQYGMFLSGANFESLFVSS